MYEMYADDVMANDNSNNVLDSWIIARLNQLVTEATAGYKNYELDKATRPITDFIDDLSVWYLRRSRDRVKGDDIEDKTLALATLRHTLRTLSLVMAPVMPFYAEYLWQAVKEENDVESVHLAVWPTSGKVDEELLVEMVRTREVVTAALEARTKSGIKVRQPIARVTGPMLSIELQSVVLDELNAKTYEIKDEIVSVDTTLTPELIAEGAVRELMRAIQERRKATGLEPHDVIVLTINTNEAGQQAIETHRELLMKTVGAKEIIFAEATETTVEIGDFKFGFSITKINSGN
jgi:isoleucyl-tRNA synthetase